MKPLIVLLITFIVGLVTTKILTKKFDRKKAGQIAMSVMLVFTAVAHFVFTEGMAQMIPDFLSYKRELVYLTGFLELAFAVGLLIPRSKTIAAYVDSVFYSHITRKH